MRDNILNSKGYIYFIQITIHSKWSHSCQHCQIIIGPIMCHELICTFKLFGKQHGFQTVLNALDGEDMQTSDESIQNNKYSQYY